MCALGPGKTPLGFYIVVHHRGLEWRTESKRLSVNNNRVMAQCQCETPLQVPFVLTEFADRLFCLPPCALGSMHPFDTRLGSSPALLSMSESRVINHKFDSKDFLRL